MHNEPAHQLMHSSLCPSSELDKHGCRTGQRPKGRACDDTHLQSEALRVPCYGRHSPVGDAGCAGESAPQCCAHTIIKRSGPEWCVRLSLKSGSGLTRLYVLVRSVSQLEPELAATRRMHMCTSCFTTLRVVSSKTLYPCHSSPPPSLFADRGRAAPGLCVGCSCRHSLRVGGVRGVRGQCGVLYRASEVFRDV